MNDAGAGCRSEWNVGSAYLLASLTLVSTLNFLDRSLLGLLLPLIKAEFQVSDTMLGVVSGSAFVVFYAIAGVPIAWVADRYNRKNIIAIGLAFWSSVTLLTGFVGSIWQLIITRFLLGAGEASSIGPSNSIVSDLFTGKNRPIAIAILGSSASISALFLVPVAGWIAIEHGWRAVFFACAVPGILLAVVFGLMNREPARAGESARKRYRFIDALRILASSRAFVMATIAECILAINLYATAIWTSSFLVRVHGLDMMGVSAVLGPLKGIAGLSGALLGGWTLSRFVHNDDRWGLRLPAIAMAIIVPAEALYLFGSSLWVVLTGFGLAAMMTAAQQPAVFSVMMGIVEPRMRATAIAIMLLFSGLVGQIVGPLTVGLLNDMLDARYGDAAIRYSLSICAISVIFASIALFHGAGDPALARRREERRSR